jgi:tRNA uridine 5-carbamoylmethylation protein Kti12
VKPSALAWVRLNSVPVIRAARPTVARAFVAAQVGFQKKLKSLDDLEPNIITDLNARMSKLSNDTLEQLFLEYLKGTR